VKRCYVCGREGSRRFRWIPETVITHLGPPFTVGGWWECAVKRACWQRFDRLRPRTYEEAA
jgi:hypothetical protein